MVTCWLVATLGMPSAWAVVPEPLIPRDFPDPEVIVADGVHYAYATGTERQRVPYAVGGVDGASWQVGGDALPRRPRWMAVGAGAWAPDVSVRPNGDYLLYFTGPRAGDGTLCVGAATAPRPEGPFRPAPEPLVCESRLGGVIDPASFVAEDGRRYLVYKTNADPATIWLQPVEPGGMALGGAPTPLLRADRPDEGGIVEAPVLVRRPSGYVLFYAANHFRSRHYQTRYATASSLKGPYRKAGGPLLTSASTGIESPGGADVAAGHLYFHGWLGGGREVRAMYRLAYRWAGDRPVVPGRSDVAGQPTRSS